MVLDGFKGEGGSCPEIGGHPVASSEDLSCWFFSEWCRS